MRQLKKQQGIKPHNVIFILHRYLIECAPPSELQQVKVKTNG